MDKQELINELKLARASYSNEDRFRGGVRTGLGIALGVIDKLDEPEKVIIPKFVADWIDEMKQDKRPFYSVMSTLMNKTNHEWAVWKSANMNFSEIVAQAWLEGYEVEKEKLYYVKLPNTNSKSEYLYLAQGSVSGDCWFNSRLERLDYEAGACKHKFTEKEIKAIDKRYWNFAVEVADE